MVDRKPRVAVTLSDETRELVQQLADLEGTSASRVVAGIVEQFAPTIKQLIDAMAAFKAAPAEKQAQIASQLEAMEADVLGKATDAQDALTNALGQVHA